MRIPDYLINQINAQADLVAIIRRHTTLKPAGKEFKGCCPFHGEKTPSFFVNPETNLYYCFGCGAKGNAVSFLVDYEKLSFVEAVKELANQTGISLPKDDNQKISYARTPRHALPSSNQSSSIQKHTANAPQSSTQNSTPQNNTPHSNAQADDKQATDPHAYPPPFGDPNVDNRNPPLSNLDKHYLAHDSHYNDSNHRNDGNLYHLLQAVGRYYQAMLAQHPAAQAYLLERGLSLESIALFEIGYAPTGWQHLETAFAQDIAGLKMLGLVRTSSKGRDFDLLRDRIIFPIKDRQGQIVGFAGRALADDVEPKYLNSSDSIVFQKQHILYGYYESRRQRASDWLVVEGYMDVIALYQAGIYGAVAPMGTAVNENQLANLLKFNDQLTLCFDGDKAGQKAALRSLEVAMPILQDGKQLKFLILPDNHDPDSFIKAHGAAAMRQAMTQALPLSDYLFYVFYQKYDLSQAEQKAAAMAELKALSNKLPKGSSFRWWLNSDIYNRLKAVNNQPKPIKEPTQYTQVSPSVQLLLCILYYPHIIQNNPLQTLYQDAQLYAIDQEFAHKLSPLPALPTWQQLHCDGLDELITAAHAVLPFLIPIDYHQDTAKHIDANAHLILAGLDNPTLQADLATQWREFFNHTHHHPPEQVRLLFDELLCHALIENFRHKLSQTTGLLTTSLYKKRLIALEEWDKHTIKPAIEAAQTYIF